MYIVWRKRPVKGDTRALFLQDPLSAYGEDSLSPWKPLHCEHRGPDRVAWTPLAVCSERRGGQPRQKLLWRLPTIRSCCIADRMHRAAWWYEVDRTIALWEESVWHDALDDIRRDRRAILAKLREVVPPPTPAGVRDFTAYRVQKEQEYQARMARIRAEDEAFHAEQRRREEEAWRRAEGQRRAGQQGAGRQGDSRGHEWFDEWFQAHPGPASSTGCFADLGLTPDATREQVKRRYYELAMQHHPDRGGDEEQFKRFHEAYKEACAFLERRTPA